MPRCKSITRYIPATCAWVLLLSATALFFIFPCQYLQEKYHFTVTICQGIITFFVVSNFFLATFMDPGIIKKANPDEDKDDDFRAPLYKNVEINGITVRMKWCVTCQFYRPPRCSHCSVCNTCIETFDHHCPWVNNCIGRRNYRHFFFFLIFLSIHMITIFIWCVLFILHHRETLHDTKSIVTLIIIAIIGILFIPVIGLTAFHIVLVARGRTTNEQVTGKFQGGFNPFSRGCFYNCCYILCGPRFPKKKSSSHSHLHHYNSLSASSGRADNSLRVYMDNSNTLLNSSHTKNSLHQQSFNKTLNSACRSDGSIPLERIDSASQSQSRDCEPSPPLSPPNRSYAVSSPISPSLASSSFKQSNYPVSSAHHPHSHHHFPSSHYAKSQQSYQQQSNYPDVSYQVTMRRTENGKTETTFPVTSERTNSPTHVAIAAGHTPYYSNNSSITYYNSQRPVSPAKSTSISEISSQTHRAGPAGGMVIYYSSDSYCMSDNSKFASETELQHMREHHHRQHRGSGDACESVSHINNASHFTKRPMSFMKALEMADKIERTDTHSVASPKQKQQHLLDTSANEDRQSQYEMNYEISV